MLRTIHFQTMMISRAHTVLLFFLNLNNTLAWDGCESGMCGAAFYSAGRGGAKVKIRGAGRKSAQINQFKKFTKVRKI